MTDPTETQDYEEKANPFAHASSHQDAGSDEISVAGLSGELADSQPPKAHDLAGALHNEATLAALNAKLSDATLDDHAAARTPTAHASTHQLGGSDEIDTTGLSDALRTDGTAGRVLRYSQLKLSKGTNANTLKAQMWDIWNSTSLGPTDNIAKGQEVGPFSLSADGTLFTILASALEGTVLAVLHAITTNYTATTLYVLTHTGNGDLNLAPRANGAIDAMDWTTLLVTDKQVFFRLLYITDT